MGSEDGDADGSAVGWNDTVGTGVGWEDRVGGADGALLLLGVKLGVTEGGSVFIVGALVGEFVGTFVGAFVGTFVGAFVGTFVGAFVGVFVGEFDGDLVGAFVGGFDGARVGLFVGDLLGVRRGAEVGDVVFNAIVGLFVGALVNKAAVGAVVLNCATAASIADAKTRIRARLVFIFCLNKSSKMRLHRCHTPREIALSSQNLCNC